MSENIKGGIQGCGISNNPHYIYEHSSQASIRAVVSEAEAMTFYSVINQEEIAPDILTPGEVNVIIRTAEGVFRRKGRQI